MLRYGLKFHTRARHLNARAWRASANWCHSMTRTNPRYHQPDQKLTLITGHATPDATAALGDRFPLEHTVLPRCSLSVGRIGFGGDDLGELADKRRRKLHTFVAKRGCNLVEIDIDGQHMRRDPDQLRYDDLEEWRNFEAVAIRRLLELKRCTREELVIVGVVSLGAANFSAREDERIGPKDVVERAQRSLRWMGLESFDILVANMPRDPQEFTQQDVWHTVEALEDAVDQGAARWYGLGCSQFTVSGARGGAPEEGPGASSAGGVAATEESPGPAESGVLRGRDREVLADASVGQPMASVLAVCDAVREARHGQGERKGALDSAAESPPPRLAVVRYPASVLQPGPLLPATAGPDGAPQSLATLVRAAGIGQLVKAPLDGVHNARPFRFVDVDADQAKLARGEPVVATPLQPGVPQLSRAAREVGEASEGELKKLWKSLDEVGQYAVHLEKMFDERVRPAVERELQARARAEAAEEAAGAASGHTGAGFDGGTFSADMSQQDALGRRQGIPEEVLKMATQGAGPDQAFSAAQSQPGSPYYRPKASSVRVPPSEYAMWGRILYFNLQRFDSLAEMHYLWNTQVDRAVYEVLKFTGATDVALEYTRAYRQIMMFFRLRILAFLAEKHAAKARHAAAVLDAACAQLASTPALHQKVLRLVLSAGVDVVLTEAPEAAAERTLPPLFKKLPRAEPPVAPADCRIPLEDVWAALGAREVRALGPELLPRDGDPLVERWVDEMRAAPLNPVSEHLYAMPSRYEAARFADGTPAAAAVAHAVGVDAAGRGTVCLQSDRVVVEMDARDAQAADFKRQDVSLAAREARELLESLGLDPEDDEVTVRG